MQSLPNILALEKFTNPLSLNIPLWLQTLVSENSALKARKYSPSPESGIVIYSRIKADH